MIGIKILLLVNPIVCSISLARLLDVIGVKEDPNTLNSTFKSEDDGFYIVKFLIYGADCVVVSINQVFGS